MSSTGPTEGTDRRNPLAAFLRDWTVDDAARLLDLVGASSGLRNQFGAQQLTTVGECEQFICSTYAPGQESQRHFAIELNGQLVGNIGLTHIDRTHEMAWVSYWVGAEARGHQLATRGLITACDWAFRKAGLFRLELGHRVNNPASCVVAGQAGFVTEGVERAKLKYGSERFDVELHARLATDPEPDHTGLGKLPYLG
ncbi:GNAT family protein [Kocuria carniphila]|uniref:GNAT family N-acetyltransferase n=1 Tax=Kocuria carniphila TaxID=262208 RepID=UPI0028EEA868|nr:GNAT family protein [Kocuria carniphila]